MPRLPNSARASVSDVRLNASKVACAALLACVVAGCGMAAPEDPKAYKLGYEIGRQNVANGQQQAGHGEANCKLVADGLQSNDQIKMTDFQRIDFMTGCRDALNGAASKF